MEGGTGQPWWIRAWAVKFGSVSASLTLQLKTSDGPALPVHSETLHAFCKVGAAAVGLGAAVGLRVQMVRSTVAG